MQGILSAYLFIRFVDFLLSLFFHPRVVILFARTFISSLFATSTMCGILPSLSGIMQGQGHGFMSAFVNDLSGLFSIQD